MIGKHDKGSSPYQILSYVLHKPGAEFLTTNMQSEITPAALTKELEASWKNNHRIQRTVYHASLSLNGEANEYFDSPVWCKVARDYLEGMEFSRVPYVAVRHTDTDNDHIHIVAGRCDPQTNRCVRDDFDHLRARKVIQALEQQYELTPTADAWRSRRNYGNIAAIRIKKQTGDPTAKEELQDLIDAVCREPIDLTTFQQKLDQQGATFTIAPTRNRQHLGISYHYQGWNFSGSQLGGGYTLKGLNLYKDVKLPSGGDDAVLAWQTEAVASRQILTPSKPLALPSEPPSPQSLESAPVQNEIEREYLDQEPDGELEVSTDQPTYYRQRSQSQLEL